jgi:2-dehydro-3-deoxy-D-arabinonate dehydratase
MTNNDMFLIQYSGADGKRRLGLEVGDQLMTQETDASLSELDSLLTFAPAGDLLAVLQDYMQIAVQPENVTRHAPVGNQEVWAAGVTYKRSEEARELESNNSSIYTRVYSAQRPELFFKSMGYDVIDLAEPVGIRYDATWSVPEPELVVVLNSYLEVIGFTIGNDMSSRDIEGENPLYLPQAKVYDGACAIGPRIWLQPGATQWPDVTIELQIEREGQSVFSDTVTTASLHRSLSDLVDYLGRCKRFPKGVMLFTGTGIIPPDSFTLAAGDTVRIRIDPIGELINTVRIAERPQEHTAQK